MLKCSVKDVYAGLVENNDSLKCLDIKWNEELYCQIGTKITFDNFLKTTYDTCL